MKGLAGFLLGKLAGYQQTVEGHQEIVSRCTSHLSLRDWVVYIFTDVNKPLTSGEIQFYLEQRGCPRQCGRKQVQNIIDDLARSGELATTGISRYPTHSCTNNAKPQVEYVICAEYLDDNHELDKWNEKEIRMKGEAMATGVLYIESPNMQHYDKLLKHSDPEKITRVVMTRDNALADFYCRTFNIERILYNKKNSGKVRFDYKFTKYGNMNKH